LHYVDLVEGTGPVVPPGATVKAHYTGTLADGTKFGSSRERAPLMFRMSKVIAGWQEGIPGMKVGGRRKLIVPPELGYGTQGYGRGVVPPNALLVFDVEVLDLVSK
jgi:peptidylprolyl isomerase